MVLTPPPGRGACDIRGGCRSTARRTTRSTAAPLLSCDDPGERSGRGSILARRQGRRQSAARIVLRSAGHRAARPPLPSPYAGRVQLDDRDLAIVAALQEDARATYSDVAGRIGMSQSAVHDRVRKLESAGVIRGDPAVRWRHPRPSGCRYGPRRRHAARSLAARRSARACPRLPRGRGLLQRRRRGQLHPEGARGARRPTDLEELILAPARAWRNQTRTTIVLSIPFEDRPLATGDGDRTPPDKATGILSPHASLQQPHPRRRGLVPIEDGHVRMYTCGPTVLPLRPPRQPPHVHAGRPDPARPRAGGLRVTQIMNITDVGHMTDDVLPRGRRQVCCSPSRTRASRPPEIAGEVHDRGPRGHRGARHPRRPTGTRRRPSTSPR